MKVENPPILGSQAGSSTFDPNPRYKKSGKSSNFTRFPPCNFSEKKVFGWPILLSAVVKKKSFLQRCIFRFFTVLILQCHGPYAESCCARVSQKRKLAFFRLNIWENNFFLDAPFLSFFQRRGLIRKHNCRGRKKRRNIYDSFP